MLSLVDNFLKQIIDFNTNMTARIISKERKKELKNNIVDWAYHQFEKLPLSMKSNGVLIRSFHVASPVGFFLLLIFCKSHIAYLFVFSILVLIAFFFFFFDTCIISSLENRIIGDEFNIIDPVLELFGMEISFMNRLKISYGIGSFYIATVFFLYFVRFPPKK